MENKKFKFPDALLNQIDECSRGFHLITVNQDGEFEAFGRYDDPVTEVGIMGFARMQLAAYDRNVSFGQQNENQEGSEDKSP